MQAQQGMQGQDAFHFFRGHAAQTTPEDVVRTGQIVPHVHQVEQMDDGLPGGVGVLFPKLLPELAGLLLHQAPDGGLGEEQGQLHEIVEYLAELAVVLQGAHAQIHVAVRKTFDDGGHDVRGALGDDGGAVLQGAHRVGDAQPDEADQQPLAQHDGQGDGDGAAEQVAHDSFLGQAAEDVVP